RGTRCSWTVRVPSRNWGFGPEAPKARLLEQLDGISTTDMHRRHVAELRKLRKIVVTFAVLPEFLPWCRLLHFQRRSRRTPSIYSVQICGTEIYAVITGIGMRSVREELRDLLV